MSKCNTCRICLFSAALVGQLHGQVTFKTAVPVHTDIKTNATLTNFMVSDWQNGRLYITNASQLTILDTTTWTTVATWPIQSPSCLALSGTGKLAIGISRTDTNVNPTEVEILDPVSGFSYLIDTGLPLTGGCAFAPDGTLFVSANRNDGSNIFPKLAQLSVGQTSAKVLNAFKTNGRGLDTVEISPNGKVYAIGSYNTGTLPYVWIADSNTRPYGSPQLPFYEASMTIAPNGTVYITGYDTNNWYVTTVDPATGQVATPTQSGSGHIYGMSFPSSDSGFAYGITESSVVALNVTQQSVISQTQSSTTNFALAANRQPDGTDVIAVLRDGGVDIYVANQPTINNGCVQSATFLPAFAGMTFVSCFGNFSGVVTQENKSVPAATSLGGAKVLVNGTAAPVTYVSPSQVNFILPVNTSNPGQIQVVGPQGSAAAVTIVLSNYAPGLFAWPAGSGDKSSKPLIQHPQKAFAVDATLVRGEVATVYGTGFGPVTNTPIDGNAAQGPPSLSVALGNFTITVGGVDCPIQYIGLVPGQIALYQLNFLVPDDVPQPGSGGPAEMSVSLNNSSTPLYTALVTISD